MSELNETPEQESNREQFVGVQLDFLGKILEIHPLRVSNRNLPKEIFLEKFYKILKEFEDNSAKIGIAPAANSWLHPDYYFFGDEASDQDKLQAIDRIVDSLKGKAYLKDILLYLDNTYHIQKVYYPGSGPDKSPTNTLGIERVINLNSPHRMLRALGDARKVFGDYRHNPYPNECFDTTLIFGIGLTEPEETIRDFVRITKKGGFIILGGDNGSIHKNEEDLCKSELHQVQLPDELTFPGSDKYCLVFRK